MANTKTTSRHELTASLASMGFFPVAIDMGNGRVIQSTKYFSNADGAQMTANCKLVGRGGSHGCGNWTWFANA